MSEVDYIFSNAQTGVDQSRDEIVLGADFQKSGMESAFPCLFLENILIDKGTLKRCKGYSVFGNDFTGKTIFKLMNYFSGLSHNLITVTNDNVYSFDPEQAINNPIAIFTHSNYANMDYVNYQTIVSGTNKQVLIFGNGVDNVQMWDGTTCADLKGQGYASTPGAANKAPKGKYLELFAERLWIAGISNEPDSVYCTKAGDPENFTIPLGTEANTAGASFVLPTWDSSTIIGLKALFNKMLVFKERHVFQITGAYPGQFAVDEIFNTIDGKIINGTIAGSGNYAFWLATDGIYVYNGSSFTNLSKRIQTTFDKINQNAIGTARAFVYKNKYYCFVPVGDAAYPNYLICFDFLDNAFSFFNGFSGYDVVEYKGELIFCKGNSHWYKMFDSDLMDTEPIQSLYESYMFSTGSIKYKKASNSINVLGTGNGTMRIGIVNEIGLWRTQDFALNNILTFKKNIKCKNKGRLLKIRLENLKGCDFDLKQAIVNVEVDES